ncbi:MAG: RNA polymerase sigma factor [Myxococcota bacterium]
MADGPRASRASGAGPGGESPDEADASEVDLVERAKQGSHVAFEMLVRRYSERAFRVAYRVVHDEDVARDVLQDALIKAYRGLRRFENRSAFYTWLYRIVVNLALDRRRRARPSVEWSDEVAHEVDPRVLEPEAHDPRVASTRHEIRHLVAAGVRELPDGQREVLLLREVEGLSYQEIAATMRISKGTVMSRLHYARRKMETFLRAHGVSPEDAA